MILFPGKCSPTLKVKFNIATFDYLMSEVLAKGLFWVGGGGELKHFGDLLPLPGVSVLSLDSFLFSL